MPDDNLPPVPDALENWRSEGTVKDIERHQIFVHTSGPESDHGVLIVHGYPGSSWDWQGVVDRIGDEARVVVSDMRGFGLGEKPLDGHGSSWRLRSISSRLDDHFRPMI